MHLKPVWKKCTQVLEHRMEEHARVLDKMTLMFGQLVELLLQSTNQKVFGINEFNFIVNRDRDLFRTAVVP